MTVIGYNAADVVITTFFFYVCAISFDVFLVFDNRMSRRLFYYVC